MAAGEERPTDEEQLEDVGTWWAQPTPGDVYGPIHTHWKRKDRNDER